MKKLIFFAYDLQMGGAEKVLVDFLNVLAKSYEIDLVLLRNIGELKEDLHKNINVIEIRKSTAMYIPFRYIPFWRKHVINNIVNKKEYDVAIGFIEGRSATFVADIKKDIKKIAWIHNDVNKFDIGINESEIIDTYNKLDKIVAVSEQVKKSICDKYHITDNKIKVVYNMINDKKILEKADEVVEKNDVFTFVNVGRMRKQKRQDRLIEIAKYLKDKGYKFQIQIIGDGPEEENIKKMIIDNEVQDVVQLLGLKKNPYPYIKQADCFVLSSDFEGYVIAVKEALLLKKLVISTDVTGIRELMDDGKYGVITKITKEDLQEKMEGLLTNKIDKEEIIKNLEKFDTGNKEIIDKVIGLIES